MEFGLEDNKTYLEQLYSMIEFPDSTTLNSRIPKKQLIENAQINTAGNKAIQEDIESITWAHTLKENTINIAPYQGLVTIEDEEFELDYNEIAVLQVGLRNTSKVTKINEILHRAIPYPLLVIYSDNNNGNLLLSVATKRINKTDHSKMTVERFYKTDWLSESYFTSDGNSFLSSLSIKKQSFVNFYEFYMGWVAQFIQLEKSKYLGEYTSIDHTSIDIRQAKTQAETLDKIALLESKLSALRQKIKQEDQINKKVELNIQAQSVKQELQTLKTTLKS